MKYRVVAFRSMTVCRVWDIRELRNKPMYFGCWKRLKTAKRKAAELRRNRCTTIDENNVVTDHGPLFTKVSIEVIQ